MELTSRTYDMRASIRLSSLFIEDKMQKYGENFRYLASIKSN